jgi:hypothetical protein
MLTRVDCIRFGWDRVGVRVTIRSGTAAATAVVIERWKPSARSGPGARCAPRYAAVLASPGFPEPASPFQSARETFVGSDIEFPRRDGLCDLICPWRTERARAARVHFSRLRDLYLSERSERRYVAQRPRAARGLSSHHVECGAATNRFLSVLVHTKPALHPHPVPNIDREQSLDSRSFRRSLGSTPSENNPQ